MESDLILSWPLHTLPIDYYPHSVSPSLPTLPTSNIQRGMEKEKYNAMCPVNMGSSVVTDARSVFTARKNQPDGWHCHCRPGTHIIFGSFQTQSFHNYYQASTNKSQSLVPWKSLVVPGVMWEYVCLKDHVQQRDYSSGTSGINRLTWISLGPLRTYIRINIHGRKRHGREFKSQKNCSFLLYTLSW